MASCRADRLLFGDDRRLLVRCAALPWASRVEVGTVVRGHGSPFRHVERWRLNSPLPASC